MAQATDNSLIASTIDRARSFARNSLQLLAYFCPILLALLVHQIDSAIRQRLLTYWLFILPVFSITLAFKTQRFITAQVLVATLILGLMYATPEGGEHAHGVLAVMVSLDAAITAIVTVLVVMTVAAVSLHRREHRM